MAESERPERKDPSEQHTVRRRMAETASGRRAADVSYPYFQPQYEVPWLHIGTERQLFLDNFILDHLDGVVRVIPTPERPAAPILDAQDHPWERSDRIWPAAALQDPDDGIYKLWYTQALVDDPFADRGMILCYAESSDCRNWAKPVSDRCRPFEGCRETNIVLEDSGHHIALVLNPDRSDPERKYLMVYNPGDRARAQGKRVMSTMLVSPDGLRWTEVNADSPQRHHHFQRAIWDESIQRWITYSQYSHHWNFNHRKRQIGRQESADFIHWSPKEVVLSADWESRVPPHVEFHDMSVRKVGGLYIGIVTEFAAEPIWCFRGGNNWRDTAYATLSLYCSRDGVRWQRASGEEPWAANGPPGSYDAGFIANSVAGQLVHGGKSYVLHGARHEKQHWYGHEPPRSPGDEESGIHPEEVFAAGARERATLVADRRGLDHDDSTISALILREEGWAQLRSEYETGRVITRQFVFEGDRLRLNADVCGGSIRVEVLDPMFRPYAGFALELCDPLAGGPPDQVWHEVRWQGSGDVRPLWNKPVRLIFHLQHASIYAFEFAASE